MRHRDFNKFICGEINYLLERNSITPESLSQRIGITPETIYDWLSGQHDFLISEIEAIENHFNVELTLIPPTLSRDPAFTSIELKHIVEKGLKPLTVRAQNAIRGVFTKSSGVLDFFSQLEQIRHNPGLLTNVGKRTIVEIERFIQYMDSFRNASGSERIPSEEAYMSIAQQLADRFLLPRTYVQNTARSILNKEPFLFGLIYNIIQ